MSNEQISSLAKKLLIKPGQHWLFYNAPEDYLAFLEPVPEGATVTFNPEGHFHGIQLFVRSSSELSSSLKIIAPLLEPDTIFWISYPKRSSGIDTDLKMGSWDILKGFNLQGVASIVVNDTWAGSRFRPMGQSKISGVGNAQIRENEFSAYIDVDNKIVTLPSAISNILKPVPEALSFYQQLSYSNKKEYVLWILTAKQEKTRTERLTKLVEKLLSEKKNPSEK
ncbi:MAG: YdeI/OmpD-associated family protein [Bacteroidota bacterium]|nr:YdeI/OmpD-associated family protein [Bacteroidota bacterium]